MKPADLQTRSRGRSGLSVLKVGQYSRQRPQCIQASRFISCAHVKSSSLPMPNDSASSDSAIGFSSPERLQPPEEDIGEAGEGVDHLAVGEVGEEDEGRRGNGSTS